MKHYSIEFKEQILKEVREVGSVSLISRKHSVPTTTIHTWQKRLKTSELSAKAKDDKDLKKKLFDLELENKILKELLKKTHQAWLKE